jgi:hypothetical protein
MRLMRGELTESIGYAASNQGHEQSKWMMYPTLVGVGYIDS